MRSLAIWLLMFAVYPSWVAAGTLDWACHRRSRIQDNAGVRENAFHWLLYLQGGAGIVLLALCEVTGGLLLVLAALFLLHELTVYVELRYAVPRRPVGPAEQMVHSFQELLPLVALALLAIVAGDRLGVIALQPRGGPWPWAYVAGAVAATVLFNQLPLAEETWRCVRVRPRTPVPPAPR